MNHERVLLHDIDTRQGIYHMPHATAVRTVVNPIGSFRSRAVERYARRWIHPRLLG
jgi:hypothetical protein